MKKIIIFVGIIVVIVAAIFAFGNNSHTPVRIFNHSGEVELGGTRLWSDTITPSTGSAFSIDISSAGFSVVPRVQVTATRSTATANAVPNVAVKSVTTTAIVVNITEGNPSTTTILGIQVLSGAPIIFVADPSTIVLNVMAAGK